MGLKEKTIRLGKKTESLGKKISHSVLAKMALAIVAGYALLNIAHMANVSISHKKAMSQVFQDQLSDKTLAVTSFVGSNCVNIMKSLKALPTIIPSLDRDLSARNYDALASMLDGISRGYGNHGYVVTDSHGSIVATSFSRFTQDQALDLTSFVNDFLAQSDTHSYLGNLSLLNEGPCNVTALGLSDAKGAVAAYVIMAQASFRSNSFLSGLSSMFDVSLSVFEGDVCTASSIPPSDAYAMVGSRVIYDWLPDSIRIRKKVYSTDDVVAGRHFFSSFSPILDYKADVIGYYHASVDDSIVAASTASIITSTLVNGSVIALIVIVFLVYFFRLHLTKPLADLKDAAERIAEGDLSTEIDVPYNHHDEVQCLGESMKAMRESLSSTISSVIETAKLVNYSSNELSHASMALAEGANKQAAALEEISSSLEQMASNIHQNTENSVMTDELMIATDKAVTSIADVATESMNDTRRIADSIRSINGLVSQTNIVSLNASVEAARAGHAGKGFSVVAKEVGRLADQTRHTAENVASTANKSISGAENINSLLDEVTPQLHRVVELVKEITASSQEQSIGADQINVAVGSLNRVTQETAASAEEISANAQELAATATRMNSMVNEFTV